jgi:hypothetical protein
MVNSSSTERSRKDAQLAALLASGAIIIGFALYWTVQIQDTLAMLALAYG